MASVPQAASIMPTVLSCRLGLFFAALFLVAGVQLPFWPVWLSGRGLDAAEIGALLAVGQWAKVAAIPLVGMIADHNGDRRSIMFALAAGSFVGFLFCLPDHGFVGLMLLNTATGICLAALIPLGDSLALAVANDGQLDYGRVRLWGTLGFIAATLAGGHFLAGRGAEAVLRLLLGATALTTVACMLLPRIRVPARVNLDAGWSPLPVSRKLVVFLAAATLIQASHGVYYLFGTLHWQSLGFSSEVIAGLWAEGAVAEVLLFFWGRPLLRRFGPLALMTAGGAAGVVRWAVTAFAEALPVLALVQLLHASTFAATHLGAMHYLTRNVPAERSATGQALYSATVGGLGSGLIMLGSGALYASIGALAYLAMAISAGLGALLAALLARREATVS